MQQNNELKKDIVAGIIGYLTMVYIVVVNGSILNEAGLSLEAGMIATILASFAGTMLMGFFWETSSYPDTWYGDKCFIRLFHYWK